MSNSNELINLLAVENKDEADSAFNALIQNKIADALEVAKVGIASGILADLQETHKHTHQVVYTVPGEGKKKQYFHVTADDDGHAKEQLKDAQPTAKIHKVEKINEGEGMDAQRRWVRQVGAIAKEGGLTRKSIHRAELKQAARKYFQRRQPHGAQFVDQGAGFIRDARRTVKRSRTNEALEGGSQSTNAMLNRNILTNIRKATQVLRVKGVNPTIAAAGHRDFAKLVSKHPKAPGYMLLRKLAPNKAQAVQTLTQAGVPLGGALEAHPNDFNQALQRIKRFK